jgi:hypothetical protein
MERTGREHAEPIERSRAKAREEALYPTEALYPVEQKVGKDLIKVLIAEVLRPSIARWYASLGKPRLVGACQLLYYKRGNPSKVVAPDVYDLPGVPPDTRIRSWQVWKTGIVPDLAIEVVSSSDPYKDDADPPPRYAELGVKELVIFDPDYEQGSDRVRWQRFRRLKRRGFVRVGMVGTF